LENYKNKNNSAAHFGTFKPVENIILPKVTTPKKYYKITSKLHMSKWDINFDLHNL